MRRARRLFESAVIFGLAVLLWIVEDPDNPERNPDLWT